MKVLVNVRLKVEVNDNCSPDEMLLGCDFFDYHSEKFIKPAIEAMQAELDKVYQMARMGALVKEGV